MYTKLAKILLRNQAAGKRIVYRVGTTKGDISGNHNDYRVTATEKVNGTKVTFKGGEKMVYLIGWTKDGQNHAMYFERPVNRDMAKAIIANTVAPTAHMQNNISLQADRMYTYINSSFYEELFFVYLYTITIGYSQSIIYNNFYNG